MGIGMMAFSIMYRNIQVKMILFQLAKGAENINMKPIKMGKILIKLEPQKTRTAIPQYHRFNNHGHTLPTSTKTQET